MQYPRRHWRKLLVQPALGFREAGERSVAATGEDKGIVAKPGLPLDQLECERWQYERAARALLAMFCGHGPRAVERDVRPTHCCELFAPLRRQQCKPNDSAKSVIFFCRGPYGAHLVIIENARPFTGLWIAAPHAARERRNVIIVSTCEPVAE